MFWLLVTALLTHVGLGFMYQTMIEQGDRVDEGQIRYPLAAGQDERLPPLPRLQQSPGERDLRLSPQRTGSPEYLWVAEPRSGHGAHPDCGGHAADGRARPAGASAGCGAAGVAERDDARRLERRADHATEKAMTMARHTAHGARQTAQGPRPTVQDECWSLRRRLRVSALCLAVCALCLEVATAQPQYPNGYGNQPKPGIPASEMPAQLKEVTFQQRLDQTLPLDATFKDERGPYREAGRLLRATSRWSSRSCTCSARCCARR